MISIFYDVLLLIEFPDKNGRLFADDIFRCISWMNEKFCISIKISLKFVSKGRIDNIPALVKIMVWGRIVKHPKNVIFSHYNEWIRRGHVWYSCVETGLPFPSEQFDVCNHQLHRQNKDSHGVESWHYDEVKMSAMASQISSLTIIYSTIYSGADKKKPSKLCVTDFRAENSPVTGEFPAQMASNAESVSIWWGHYDLCQWLYSWWLSWQRLQSLMPQLRPTTGPVRFLSPARFFARKAEWSARRNFTSVLFSWSHQAADPARLDTAVHLWLGRIIRRTPGVPRAVPVRASVRGPCGTRKGAVRHPCGQVRELTQTELAKIPHGCRIWPYGARTAPHGMFAGWLQYQNPYGARKLIMHALKLYGARTGRQNSYGAARGPCGPREWTYDFCSKQRVNSPGTARTGPGVWCDWGINDRLQHFNDVIIGVMASQIASFTIDYSSVYSGADQRKHQSSASLAFVRAIHRWPVNSPHQGPVTRKIFSEP